ncbi:ribonuclease h2 subunit a [Ceraceosorus bombacis]|uniref:Ribonuclease n=1 Tax=Ceraceosorus bombacis TaxID=401625 RepID=A0A0P1BJP6_9BASI|nr:ribonuclease h2 subunit a [Ceraceosorus bombacis]
MSRKRARTELVASRSSDSGIASLSHSQSDSLLTLDSQPDPSSSSAPASHVPSISYDRPQLDTYTWRSSLPKRCKEEPCVLGVDEAGRGPVLGPLVYGIAYCPLAFHDLQHGGLKDVGFADSKALTAERRDALLNSLQAFPDTLGWAVRSMSPQDISSGMLRRRPVNLNAQSLAATMELIQGTLDAGVNVVHVYVDTVGDPKSYQRQLSSAFPKHIQWTVTSKADALFEIVGAASIAAKVTRDAALDAWLYAEKGMNVREPSRQATESREKYLRDHWETGSGYPGDPKTVAFLNRTMDPVFGYPGIVRFSWATVKTLMEDRVPLKRNRNGEAATNSDTGRERSWDTCTIRPAAGCRRAYTIKWNDEPLTINKFFSAKPKAVAVSGASRAAQNIAAGDEADKARSKLARELGLQSVGGL